jgi:hypothetical protein
LRRDPPLTQPSLPLQLMWEKGKLQPADCSNGSASYSSLKKFVSGKKSYC